MAAWRFELRLVSKWSLRTSPFVNIPLRRRDSTSDMALVDTRERVADYAFNFVLLLRDIRGTRAVLDAGGSS